MMIDTDPLELLTIVEKVYSSLSPEGRSELRLAIDGLSKRLETPWDTTKRIVWQEPCLKACIYTFIDLSVPQRWAEAGDEVLSAEELSKIVACDPLLLDRLLRNLAANHLLISHGPGRYAMTGFIKCLMEPEQKAAWWYSRNIQTRMINRLPSYLHGNKYCLANASPRTTAFSQAFVTNDSFFVYLSQHPDFERNFALCMRGVSRSMKSWVDIYPTEELVRNDGDNQLEVILVDVGGGTGHDINALQQKHRMQPGRLILQDLEKVLEQAEVEPDIAVMAHDFFKPQTIEARAYYLHSVLHDWPDKEACGILKSVKAGMRRGSIILLHELVKGCPITSQTATWMDITMLAAFNSCERDLKQWQNLVERAGLEMTGHYCHPDTPYSVIKLEVPARDFDEAGEAAK